MTAMSGCSRGGDEEKANDAMPPEEAVKPHHDGAQDASDDEALEMELMLLALTAQDTGEPTHDVDLGTLTQAEKHALLALWRDRLGMPWEREGGTRDEGFGDQRGDDRGEERE